MPPPKLSAGDADGFIDLTSPSKESTKSSGVAPIADPEAMAKAEFKRRFERHAAVPNDPRKLMHSQSKDFELSIMRLVSQDDSEQQPDSQKAVGAATEASSTSSAVTKPAPLRVECQTVKYHQAADRDSLPSACSRQAFNEFRANLMKKAVRQGVQSLEERYRRYEEFKKENEQKNSEKDVDKSRHSKSGVVNDEDESDEEYEPSNSDSSSGSDSSDSEAEEAVDDNKTEEPDCLLEEAEETSNQDTNPAVVFSQDSQVDLFSNSNTAGSASIFGRSATSMTAASAAGAALLGGQRLPSQLPDTPQPTQYQRELSTSDDWFSTQELQQDALVQSQLHFDNSQSATGGASGLPSSSVGAFPSFTPLAAEGDKGGTCNNNNSSNAFPDFITQAPLVAAKAVKPQNEFPDCITQTEQARLTQNEDGIDVAAYGIVDESVDNSADDDLAKALMLSGVVNPDSQDDALQEMPAAVRSAKSSSFSAMTSKHDVNSEDKSDNNSGQKPDESSNEEAASHFNDNFEETSNDKSGKDSKDKSKISDNNDDVNEDEADEEIGIQKLRNKIQTRQFIVGSDEEDEDEGSDEADEESDDDGDAKSSDNEEEEESEDNNEGDEDEERAADSADDNIKSDSRKRRLRQRDFLEEEAELSGSDDGGADDVDNPEDGDSLDQALAAELEGMIDDDEDALGGRSKVRRQVARIQHAMETDEDRRRLDQLKELLLPDGELADESDADGGVRKWRFNRWKELQERRDAAEAAARAGLEDACWGDGEDEEQRRREEEEQEAEARAEQALRIERHKREKFLEEQEQQQQHRLMLQLAAQESQSGLSITAQHPNQHHQHLLEDSSSQQSQFFRDMHARVLKETSNSASKSIAGQMLPPKTRPVVQQKQQQQKQQQQQPDCSASLNKRKNFAPIKRSGSFLTRSRDSSASLRQLVAKSAGSGGGGDSGLKAAVAAAAES
uniref:MRC1 domain-containing protein n=1 Tax=Macrostomum lignano TaxID=282301 RepID=A0A1I8GWV2_9PLAT